MDNDIFEGTGVEVTLNSAEDFLKVKETLARIGVASYKTKTLYPSCYILHKRGRYAIVHFKELFWLDGKESSVSESDFGRRNTICRLLSDWNLVNIIDPNKIANVNVPVSSIKILSHKIKNEWQIVHKYDIGAVN